MRRAIPLVVLSLTLAACATRNPPPVIDYDELDFQPAVQTADPPRPVEIVTLPEAVPMPGQLRRVSDGESESEPDDPNERVAIANADARVDPTRDGYINAIQVYPYMPGALYQLFASPGQVSDIALQPGERLISVSAGDTVRWVVGDTVSGSGDAERAHILVKPTRPDITTNLVVNTDRRSYHIELHSTEDAYMAAVSWDYPHDSLIALRRRNAAAEAADAVTVDRGLDLNRLRFRYRINGDDPPWRPVRVFDDQHKVYIEFPRGLSQGEAPPLFVVGPTGGTQLVNYRVRGHYYIVDRLFAAAELRLGDGDSQQVVRIERTDGRPRGLFRHASFRSRDGDR